jgi:cell division protein FtsQ
MSRGATRKINRKVNSRNRADSLLRHVRPVLLGMGLLAGVLLLLAGGWRLAKVPVERVVFSGDLQRVPRAELELLVNDNLDGGFLGVDIDEIRRPLETLPWVFRVVVKRRWPSDLEIVVTEQIPIARWGEESYLNRQGEVFKPSVYEEMPELPSLEGPMGSQLELMQRYQFMHEQMQVLELEIVALSMDARGGLVATLHTGGKLVFGRGQLEQKLARFLGVYHADLVGRESQIRSVDLRYRHGLAVAWRTG